jgi:hypothetical protein
MNRDRQEKSNRKTRAGDAPQNGGRSPLAFFTDTLCEERENAVGAGTDQDRERLPTARKEEQRNEQEK